MLEAGSVTPAASACGTCTMCCTLMRVAMDPPKPERHTCEHCTGIGCGIYAERPEVCAGFQCLWLASQRTPAYALDPALRPDRSGVVIDLNCALTLIAHCERADSWRREPMRSWLLHQAHRTNVILELPDGAALLTPAGETEALVKAGVDPISNNRLYVRVADMARAGMVPSA